MNEAEYSYWWQLHVRAARGESLSAEEQAVYDAGRGELERSERLQPLWDAKQSREELRKLEAERTRLEQQRRELDAEIAALESNLAPQARELLGVEE